MKNAKFRKTISFKKFCVVFGLFQFAGGLVGLFIFLRGIEIRSPFSAEGLHQVAALQTLSIKITTSASL